MNRVVAGLVVAAVGGSALQGCGGGSGEPRTSTGGPGKSSTSQSKTASGGGATGSTAPGASAPSGAGTAPENAYEPPREFKAAEPTAAQRSQLVNSGRATIPVQVERAGEVSAIGQAELGGEILKVAHAAPVEASGAGLVDLTLKLTPRARRYLGAGHTMMMYVGVFLSGSRYAKRLNVRLEG